MSTLFIMLPKALSQTPILEWNSIFNKRDMLFTHSSKEYGIDEAYFKKLNCSVMTFDKFNSSGLIEKKAKELHAETPFNKIIANAEADVLRCAKLREDLNLSGQHMDSAILYRDKAEMKARISGAGIKVPKFKKIHYATDLINFINDVGFDVVVKPNLGAGSANTHIIKDDAQLNDLLANGLIDSSYGTPDLIAESFVKGRMYHVDGLVINKQIIINQPSAYSNACIEFQRGTHVGSYMLEESNSLTSRLRELNRDVIASLPSPDNFAFHAEYFHDDDDELIFCEIASRPGGAIIKDAIYAKYGINIVTEWIRSELNESYKLPEKLEISNALTGFILIPPKVGILKYIPDKTPFTWVKQYRVTANLNEAYKGNAKTSGEIISIMVNADNESELLGRINTVSSWVDENVIWA